MKTLTVLGRKGGIGKTTTALALGYGLHDRGYRVLLIDTDAQANLTENALNDQPSYSLNDLLSDDEPDFERALLSLKDGLCLIASDPESDLLASFDKLNFTDNPEVLKEVVKHYSADFDFCIIDTPPNMGFFTQLAMNTADRLIIPLLADRNSVSGLEKLLRNIDFIQEGYNPGLKIEGLLITRFTDRGRLNQQFKDLIEKAAESLQVPLFKSPIHETIKQREAHALGVSIFEHAPRNRIVKDYQAMIDEVLEREG